MYEKYIKRILDIIFALILLVPWLFILIIIGLLVYKEDKGPIFYNSLRLGQYGKPFKMYKFRSMKVNAPDIRNKDGSTYNSENDPRLTRIGKFIRKTSIDETPQILNVLKGEMSFVGPRPDLPEHKEVYVGSQFKKLEVKPGVTGYNQAYFRNTIPWKDRLENDIFYVENLTFSLDLKILVKTVLSVVKKDTVFQE